MAMGDPGTFLAACCADALVTAVAVTAGGTRHLLLAITIVSFGVLLAAISLRPLAALANAGIAWLLFDGFLVGRHAVLGWDGTREWWWMTALAGAAMCGIAIAKMLAADRLADSRHPGGDPFSGEILHLARRRGPARRPGREHAA